MTENTRFWLIFLFSFAVITILYLSFINPYPDTKYFNANDPFVYLSETYNLLKFGKFGLFNGDLFCPTKAHPPGFHIILIPVIYLFGFNLYAIKLYLITIGLATILASYKFFRIYTGRYRSLLCMLILALSPATFILSRIVMAEVSLLCFFMLALIGLDKIFFQDKPISGLILSITSVIAATMIKGTGLALLFAPLPILFSLKSKKYWNYYIIFFLISILPTLIFSFRNLILPTFGFWGHTQFWFVFNQGIWSIFNSIFTNIKWFAIYNPLKLIFPILFAPITSNCGPSEILKYISLLFCALIFYIAFLRVRTQKNILLEAAFISGLLFLLPYLTGGSLRLWFSLFFPVLIVYADNIDNLIFNSLTKILRIKKRITVFLFIILFAMIPALSREIKGLQQPFRNDMYKEYFDALKWSQINIGNHDVYYIVDFEPTIWQVFARVKTFYLPSDIPIKKAVNITNKDEISKKRISIVVRKTEYLTSASGEQEYFVNNFSRFILERAKVKEHVYSNKFWDIYLISLDAELLSLIDEYLLKTIS